jgi:subtilase family serine protease
VALLFAGSSSQTIGNRIDLVLNRFGVTIDGLDPPPPGPFTDLAVTNVTAPASVVRDETVTVTVRVRNFGNQDVPAFDVVLDDSTDGVTVGTQSVAALPPGTATTLSFTWTPASAGEHVLIGRHTLTDDRALNDQSGATVAVQAPLVDIGVVSISAPGGVSEGKTINVAVTVRNVGNQHVGDTFDVSLDNTTLGLSLGTQTVNGLAAGAGALLTFTWNTTGVPLGPYTLVASQHLSDGNAANDQQSFVVNVNPKLLDVAVANITGPPSVNQGAVAHFGVTLQNAGERDVLDTFTVVLTDATNGGALLATQSVPGLALGASSTLDLAWNTAGAAITGHTVIATQTLPDGNATNNARAIGILVKPPVVADVAVTAVNAPMAVSQGNTAAVQVTIQNIGQAASGSFDLVLTDSTAGMTIGTQTIASLGVNAATTLTFNWNTTGAALGSHALVAAHNLSDASAANNQRTATVTVNPRVVDVAVSAMTAPGSASQGSTVAVGVTVQNVGADPVTTGFAVTVTDATGGAAVGTQTVNSLAAGASVTLTFPWNTTGAVLGAHTLVATHDFADANASNNQRQVTVNVTAGVTDIALTNLTGPASVTQGDTAHFGVTVQNTGSQPVTTSFDVVLTDGTNGNAVVGIQTVAGLATGAVATLDFPWPTASVTATGHTIIARQMLADANGSNNSRAIGITVSPPSVHAGNIAATAVSNGSSWAASVEITVHDSRHNLVDGVVVRGSWGGPNVGECVTGSGGVAGKCTITYSPIPNTTFLVSFAVTSLTCTGYVYKPASNHDPDGSSNGTTVFVRRP